MSDIKQRVAELQRSLSEHIYRYNVLNDPIITDAEYDQLFAELKSLEEEYPELVTPDSPTQRVGSDLSEDFPKVPHPAPILSLGNAFSEEDLMAWEERNIRRMDSNTTFDYVLEPKLDGLTIIITYENGVLVKAATRGNGMIGDDVTANVRTIKTIPLRIPVGSDDPPPERLVVRGEIMYLKKDFEALNAEQDAKELPRYINARNTASGSIKQKDSRITASRPLTAYIYSIVDSDNIMLDKELELLEFLRNIGFNIIPHAEFYPTLSDIIQQLPKWEVKRNQLPFEIDGLVIKINDRKIADDLGVVGKDPRGAIAYKFPSEEATTKLLGVTVNIGRTGKVTPTAQLDPVFIGGVTVSNASLHNFEMIQNLDIRLGDTVIVKRSGEVIPYVIGPVIAARTGEETPITAPERCPVCNTPIVKPADAVDHFCPNIYCPERVFRSLEFFVSRGAMDIEGMGPQTIATLIENGHIRDEADIFYLKADDLLELEGFADKKVENLLQSIDTAKSRPLPQVLTSLGIDGVGGTVANLLADNFGSIDALVNISVKIKQAENDFLQVLPELSQSDPETNRVVYRLHHPLTELAPRYASVSDLESSLNRLIKPLLPTVEFNMQGLTQALKNVIETADGLMSIGGLGPVLVENVVDWFSDPHHLELIQKMRDAGVNMQAEEKEIAGDSLEGLTFVITGTLSASRPEFQTLIEKHGGKVTGSVSKKTSYVLVGESPGSKASKAEELGVSIISEEDLQDLIMNNNRENK